MSRSLFVTRSASRSRGAAAVVLACLWLCPARPAVGQVLHVVVVCDYESPDIKENMLACEADLVYSLQAVPPPQRRIHAFEPWFDPTQFEPPAAPGETKPPEPAPPRPANRPEVTEPEDWTGPNPYGQVRRIHRPPSARAVLRAIAELGPVGPRDAVACVLVGHGSYDPTPDPATGKPKGTYMRWRSSPEPLLISEIAAALRRHPARLRLVVADCCNRLRPLSRKVSATPRAMPAPQAPPGRPVYVVPPLMKSLFFDERGEIVLESSSPNEFAFIEPPVESQYEPIIEDPAPGQKAGNVFQMPPTRDYRGSLFVNAFRDTLDANPDTPFTWEQVSELMQLRVDLRIKELRYAGLLVLDDQEQRGPSDQRRQTLRLSRGR